MSLLRIRPFVVCSLRYVTGTAGKTPSPPPPPPPKAPTAQKSAAQEPPEDATKYNVPEYYKHNDYSFYDVDAAMAKFRLPQPSKYDPLKPKK